LVGPSPLCTFVVPDKDRTRVKFTLKDCNGKKVSRMATLDEVDPECGCGRCKIDEMPCGCLLYAAGKAGMSTDAMLDEHDIISTWKSQYKELTDFKIPGNEDILLLAPDALTPLPPVTYPQKPGRPTKARVKSALEQSRKYKKNKKGNGED
jgi:hypothetical protein